jgi:hypothetical protein
MSLIKKVDVEAHFAERRRMRLAANGFTRKPASKAAAVPGRAKAAVQTNTSGFREDSSVERSSPKAPATY